MTITPRNRNIIIGVGVLIGAYFIGKYLYKRSRTPEKLTLKTSNKNDVNKSVEYEVLREDGSILTSGSFSVRDMDKTDVFGKNRVSISTDYKKDKIIFAGKSVDKTQFFEKIKFVNEDEGLENLATTIGAIQGSPNSQENP